tara:strand:- start:1501 stop:1986 length:486 start_codon:yes stop_codon:yes gene_type:complete
MELILSDLFSSDTATMTSIDIEVVTGSGHSEVKRSIERLANKGVIALPPTAIMLNKVNNRDYKTEVFVFSGDKAKRDSLIVVAQLSPEFTADIVDRWIYLEKQNKTLTKQLEYWQTKEVDDFSVGSFHGKGLAKRKETKNLNNGMIQKIKNQMQLKLGVEL